MVSYRLLERHQWRKLVPRPFHPQADKEEQRLFQQNFATWLKKRLRQEIQKTSGPSSQWRKMKPVLVG